MITLTRYEEVRISNRFLQMFHCIFAYATHVLLFKSNQQKMVNMKKGPNNTHVYECQKRLMSKEQPSLQPSSNLRQEVSITSECILPLIHPSIHHKNLTPYIFVACLSQTTSSSLTQYQMKSTQKVNIRIAHYFQDYVGHMRGTLACNNFYMPLRERE